MDKENFDYKKSTFSPMDNYYWIEQSVFEHLQNEAIFNVRELEKLKARYKELFKTALPKVEHLMNNELDKGNIYFVLVAVSVYEVFLELGITKSEAFFLTDSSVNKPVSAYVTDGTKKLFDDADDPFYALVQSSKEREEHYFGNSFEFERPIDTQYGYILNIKKCLFHETLKILDRKELQPILCKMDLGWIHAIDPDKHCMQFVRPITFATGNSCQMWFMRKEPANLDDL